jgi:predicted DNA-binding protein YlxM (UPF0122 family)
MSWETTFESEIILNRLSFTNEIAVQDEIDELKQDIEVYKTKLSMFASSNIKDVIPDDWKEQPIDWLTMQLNELHDVLQEKYVMVYKLELYIEYLKSNK